jgi:hypothetical protein
MPSHTLPSLSPSHYPQPEINNYYPLHRSVYDNYYAVYGQRIRHNGYTGQYLTWFNNTFSTNYPASFVVDNKNKFILSPGENLRWLVFLDTGGDVHMHLARYLVVNGGRVQLFGDGPTGTQLDTEPRGVSVSGVVVPHDPTTDMVSGDVSSL